MTKIELQVNLSRNAYNYYLLNSTNLYDHLLTFGKKSHGQESNFIQL